MLKQNEKSKYKSITIGNSKIISVPEQNNANNKGHADRYDYQVLGEFHSGNSGAGM
jgi:hypothetical protein